MRKKIKRGRKKEKKCVEKREGVLEKAKTGKKTKKVHTLEDKETASRHPCVYNNNINNSIISSVASKQQSDTSTTQAGAWCLLGRLANKHPYIQ